MDIDWKGALDADAEALPKLIARAEAGDHEAALRLLDIFTAMVDSGREPYPELLIAVPTRLLCSFRVS